LTRRAVDLGKNEDRRLRPRQPKAGSRQGSSHEQAAVLTSLDAWRAQYIKIARVAVRDKKQLLEKIGIPARTSQTSAQRKATLKPTSS